MPNSAKAVCTWKLRIQPHAFGIFRISFWCYLSFDLSILSSGYCRRRLWMLPGTRTETSKTHNSSRHFSSERTRDEWRNGSGRIWDIMNQISLNQFTHWNWFNEIWFNSNRSAEVVCTWPTKWKSTREATAFTALSLFNILSLPLDAGLSMSKTKRPN